MKGLDWIMLFMLVSGLLVLLGVITVAIIALPMWLKSVPILWALGLVVLLCAG